MVIMNIYKLEKIARGIIYILAFFPFIIVPYTLWPFVFVANLIFYCLVAILLGLMLVVLYKNRQNIFFKKNGLVFIILGFIGIMAISSFFSVDAENSFFGFQPRMGGLLAYLAYFGWLISIIFFLDNKEKWIFFIKLMVISAFSVTMVSVFYDLMSDGISFFPKEGEKVFFLNRFSGILGNSIFLAGYLLPHIFLSIFLFIKEKTTKNRILWLVACFVFILGIFLTQTRGSIISLAIATLFLGIFFIYEAFKDKQKIFSRLAIVFGLLVGFAGYMALNNSLLLRLSKFSLHSDTIVTRLITWKIAIEAFFSKWLFGWGPENFSYAFSKFYNPTLLKFSFYETWMDKPHNQFLEVFATTGVIGGILYICIFLYALFLLYKLGRKNIEDNWIFIVLGAAIIAYAGHIFFAFETNELRLVMCSIFGFIIFYYNEYFLSQNKFSVGLFKKIVTPLFLIIIISLVLIGFRTVRASYHTSQASDAIKSNNYNNTIKHIKELGKLDGYYQFANWEYLSDIIIKADAGGRIPVVVMREILPVAIDGLEKANDKHPDNFSYSYRLAQMYNFMGIYVDSGYVDKALIQAEKAEAISPDRQVAGILLGQIYYQKRDIDKGIEILTKMVEKNPEIMEPYWFLSILYDAKGEYEKSYAFMSTAVDNGRALKSIDDAILYVTVLGRYNDYIRMAPVYEKIISEDKENPRWWANAAVVYLEIGEYEKARQYARQAIFLDPKFGDEGENFLKQVDVKESEE